MTAFSIAFMHTVAGPDHYLPFLVLGRAENWSFKRIMFYTLAGGVAHILSSLIIGFLAVMLGWSAGSIDFLNGIRGTFAIWALVAVGVIYMIVGLIKVYLSTSDHSHGHSHEHSHDHFHFFGRKFTGGAGKRTALALIVIFLLGPCEPLIPLLLLPSAGHSILALIIIISVFAGTTLFTQACCLSLAFLGIGLFEFNIVKRYMHVFSGMAIATSGLILVFLS
ncbi:MAG: hypothetical protein JXR91_14390 [Deltaproteobacteria bacterium]|nr:hypothetical protein [Deltaproteobacteria bacterium]